MKTTRLALLALTIGSSLAHGADPVRDVGNHKQLFIDDRFIEHAQGVELRMNPPVKHGVVLVGTQPWENGYIEGGGTVLEDMGKYRMWYTATPASRGIIDNAPFRLCYAESDDGTEWRKPNLGLYKWHDSTANNMLMETANENGAGVFIDPSAPADRRYKLVAWLHEKTARHPNGNAPNGAGLYIYTSIDGLRWDFHPQRVFPFDPDTTNMALYDDRTGKYLAYVRTWNPLRRVGVIEIDDIMKPWPFDKNVAPKDLKLQGPPRAPSREIAEAFGSDENDPAGLDFYTSEVVKYPWAQDAYFMFPSAYRHFPEPPLSKLTNDGVLDVEMAVSRDGRKYHRVSRSAYIERGVNGAKDSDVLYMGVGMVRRGNEVYQYYGGYDHSHNSHGFPETRNLGAVMQTRQRLDGFVSVEAGDAGGQFSTPVVTFSGKELSLNMDSSANGDIQVELQEVDGSAVPGYSFAESDPMYLNDIAAVATWSHGQSEVGALAGRPIRIAFKLRSAKLFAFQFIDGIAN